MLDLSKFNVAGLGDCQLLVVCLSYFGTRRYDESDRNKDITTFKWSMINYFQHRTWDNQTLQKRFNFWRKNTIGDDMHREYYMNGITLEYFSRMLKQKICVFYRLFRKEHDMIGEVHVPFDNEDKAKTHALLFKDNKFNITKCGSSKNSNVKGTLCNWVKEGYVSFIWHIGLHYQAYISKSNEKFYNERSHPTMNQVPSDIFSSKFKNNSICPFCTKT